MRTGCENASIGTWEVSTERGASWGMQHSSSFRRAEWGMCYAEECSWHEAATLMFQGLGWLFTDCLQNLQTHSQAHLKLRPTMNYFSMLIISQFCITIDNAPSLCDCLCRQYAFNEKNSICAVATWRLTWHSVLVLYFSCCFQTQLFCDTPLLLTPSFSWWPFFSSLCHLSTSPMALQHERSFRASGANYLASSVSPAIAQNSNSLRFFGSIMPKNVIENVYIP